MPLTKLCLFWLLVLVLARCASPPVQPYVGTEPRNEVIYLIAGGWHTELALPLPAIGRPLAALKLDFAKARYLVFGWGARDYYMARDPGIGDLLRAAVPGPAVLLVIPLQASPETFAGAANTFAIPVSHGGAARLSQFLWEDLAKDAEGAPRRIGVGPYPGSVFYASTGTFDIMHTCNSWTAQALNVAGLPVSSVGVVYPGQLLDQLRSLAAVTPEPNKESADRRGSVGSYGWQPDVRDNLARALRAADACLPAPSQESEAARVAADDPT